jgi:hypothetical protein
MNIVTRIKTALANTFKQDTQSELDKFIASKHPTTQAELDHWLKEWDHRQRDHARSSFLGKQSLNNFWDV